MARGTKVWWNGKICPETEARISLFTHGLHYGVGAFEGIRAYKLSDGKTGIFRLKDHMQRFIESFKIMGIQIPYSVEDLVKAACETVKQNGFKECYVRPIGFTGDGPLGIDFGANPPVDVAILVWEWGAYLGDKGIKEGVSVRVSSYIRPHVNSVMTRGKINGQYVSSVLAKREAIESGFNEAIFLDTEGYVAEGTGQNLFMVRKGQIKTPPLSALLEGLTRDSVIELLRDKGKSVLEAPITRDELVCADEIFLVGTAAEVTPVSSVDKRLIGFGPESGKVGNLTIEVKSTYSKIVRGELPAYRDRWITEV